MASITEIGEAEIKLMYLLDKYRHKEKNAHSWLSSRTYNEFVVDIELALKEIKKGI
jgi:ABC-type Zn uptake system ZnuABC Zn-binding protein ZnuA